MQKNSLALVAAMNIMALETHMFLPDSGGGYRKGGTSCDQKKVNKLDRRRRRKELAKSSKKRNRRK